VSAVRVIAFAAELAVVDGRLEVWQASVYDGERHQVVRSAGELWSLLLERPTCAYSADAGRLAFWCLGDPPLDLAARVLPVDGNLAEIRLGELVLRDPRQAMPELPAGDPLTAAAWTPLERRAAGSAIAASRARELETVHAAVIAWRTRYPRAVTLGQAAMAELRAHVKLPRPSRGTLAWDRRYRPWYFGGRCEVYERRVRERFSWWDVTSAYPAAMRLAHPWGRLAWVAARLPDDEQELSRSLVIVSARAERCFPWRAPGGGLLEFPDASEEREYRVTGWELLAAQELGLVRSLRVRSVVGFRERLELGPLVERLYRERRELAAAGRQVEADARKGAMNRIYGKLGQNPTGRLDHVAARSLSPALAREGWRPVSSWGAWHLLARKRSMPWIGLHHVAAAASITGAVRAQLLRALNAAEGAIYCDTDSIVARRLDVPTGDELGAWRREDDCVAGDFLAAKLYVAERADGSYRWASKGVRLTAREILRLAQGARDVEQRARRRAREELAWRSGTFSR
jgi:hypothetical protein